VFISYSQKDEAVYSGFCYALKGAGVDFWDQHTLAVGQSLADQLREAIQVCDACVFLATKWSVESKWCMAELGAFWGAGKQVMIFITDPEVGEAQLPSQFQGNLWTRDAGKVMTSIQTLSGQMVGDVLTPDLVLLLRYLERDEQWILPDHYGKSLAVANGVSVDIGDIELRGWKRAVRYGLLYLAHHGLVNKQSDTSVTYTISEYGKSTLDSSTVRLRFPEVFKKELLSPGN
jgi:hypothetical protein